MQGGYSGEKGRLNKQLKNNRLKPSSHFNRDKKDLGDNNLKGILSVTAKAGGRIKK